jgi:Major Facilitator Superfamily
LPAIGRDFGAGLTALQWVVMSYTLTLAGLLLFAGALGDRYGRKRIFLAGVVWFAMASLVCGFAPSAALLIGARAVQGVGGALLTPGSLAIIEASFRPADRGKAIGAWPGLSAVATAIGPFLGGWLVQAVSWRLIFAINLPVAAVIIAAGVRHGGDRRRAGAVHPHRPFRELLHRGAPGGRDLRPRPGHHRGAADSRSAGRRSRPPCRHGIGRQQRRRPHGRAHRGRRPSRSLRAYRHRLPFTPRGSPPDSARHHSSRPACAWPAARWPHSPSATPARRPARHRSGGTAPWTHRHLRPPSTDDGSRGEPPQFSTEV